MIGRFARLMVLLSGMGLLLAGGVLAGQARLEAEQAAFDFGRLSEGDKVEHVFRFRNSGDVDLEITDVRTSCGCTAVVLSSRTIPPGGTGELRAVFDSRGFRGPVTKTITVTSNAAPEPFASFQLRGEVVPLIEVDPYRLEVRDLAPGVARTVEARVTNQGRQPLQILSVRATSPLLQVEMPERSLRPGASAVLKVTVTLPQDLPRVSGYIYLETDNPQARTVRLTFRGYGR